MSVVVLSVVFILTVAIGAALAKGVLTLVVRLLVEGHVPALPSLRTVATGLIALVR